MLGADGAVRIYRRFVAATLAAARELAARQDLRLVAYAAPGERASDVADWLHADAPNMAVWPQPAGDLGHRSLAAFERAFAEGAGRVVIVGTDIPSVTAGVLADAFAQLDHHDAVLGPAEDGGYWLLGLTRPVREAFTDIPWSTDRAYAVTRQRLVDAGAPPAEIATLRDVDTPDDLQAVVPHWREWLATSDEADDDAES